MPAATLHDKLLVARPDRIHWIVAALRAGMSAEEICGLTKIDPWFIRQMTEIVALERELAIAGFEGSTKEQWLAAKRAGVTDVIFPAENQQNVEEDVLPEQMEGVRVHYVSSIDEVLAIALPKSAKDARQDADTRDQVLADAKG